jgi:hypothetical protein
MRKSRLTRSLSVLFVAGALVTIPGVAPANNGSDRHVNCARGESINRALEHGDERKPLVIKVSGACVENVVITRDDVVIAGAPSFSLTPADPAQPTILVDGARRIEIDDFTVTGGHYGILAVRGATVGHSDCTIQGASSFGLNAAHGSTVSVTRCTIQNNGGGGAAAATSSQVAITDSVVQNNTGNGLVAARNGHMRVGQDLLGGAPAPVDVRGNTQNGVSTVESASAIVVGGTVEDNGGNGIVSAGGSHVSIGFGIFGAAAPVTIRGNGSHGVSAFQGGRASVQNCVIESNAITGVRFEGSAGTVIGSTIRDNGRYGVEASNSSGVRLGIADNGQTVSGNLIEQNVLEGVHVVGASSVWMAGNTVRQNSTTNGRFGMLAVEGSAIRLVGTNTITANGSIVGGQVGGGVFLRGAGLYAMRGDFTITPNTNAITGNTGDGIQAVENSTVELRDGVDVSGNTNRGLALVHGGRARLQATTVSGNGADGVQLIFGSTLRVGPAANTIADAIVCADVESSVGGMAPPPGCTGF